MPHLDDEDADYDFDYPIDVADQHVPTMVPGGRGGGGGSIGGGNSFRPTTGTTIASSPTNSSLGPLATGFSTASRGGYATSGASVVSSMTTGFPAGASRGYAASGESVVSGGSRPMTAISGAGFRSAKASAGRSFDPMNQGRKTAAVLVEEDEGGVVNVAKRMERQVHALLERSSEHAAAGELPKSLDVAREAVRRDRELSRYRETNGVRAQDHHAALTCAILLHLAVTYERNGMNEEALKAYSYLVKDKKRFPNSGRFRVNMGNIYFAQGQYQEAIKMYRMARDQTPASQKQIGYNICGNIGKAFVKLGQYRDAIENFETVMGAAPNFDIGFNLIVCYYAIGDPDRMKKGFARLISISISAFGCGNCSAAGEDEHKESPDMGDTRPGAGPADDPDEVETQRKKEREYYILTAARLIAPVLDKQDWTNGYIWTKDSLKETYKKLACKMDMELALAHIRKGNYDVAIELLKSFEKKEMNIRSMAATNLSSIYFLEGDNRKADMYATLAVKHSRFNAKALVNKGNCLFAEEKYDGAKSLFVEAIEVQPDIFEGIYNLGLTNLRLGLLDEARSAFERLHKIVPHHPMVLLRIADVYEQQQQLDEAIKWYDVLSSCVSDPNISSKMGHIFGDDDDESQALHYQLESYRNYPANLDVISWLAVWYVRKEQYEKSIHFFQRASQIEPAEVKWQLMVASCYRRMGSYNEALGLYQRIHSENPRNAECLKYLIAICKDLGHPYEEYQQKLSRLDHQSMTQNGADNRGQSSVPASRGETSVRHDRQSKTSPATLASATNYDATSQEDFSDEDDINELLV